MRVTAVVSFALFWGSLTCSMRYRVRSGGQHCGCARQVDEGHMAGCHARGSVWMTEDRRVIGRAGPVVFWR